jgi:hypothetical protein
MCVGVMKDGKVKLRDLHVSRTLKIETKLINERFASVMGECVILTS